jgi:spermidine synthase
VVDLQGKWFFESVTQDLVLLYRVKRSLYSGKTEYQEVEVLETETMGRALVLDGKTQSAETDEHIYHEALVHPALLFHPNPRSVFIGGGGEGATLREVLAHPSVERVAMVDLDPQVVALCREHLPNHSKGAFDDPRAKVEHQDARRYLAEGDETFDVMVLDLVDPLEEGTAYTLYTREFYEIARSKLNPGGLLVTQSGPTSLLNYRECFTAIVHTLSGLFPRVLPYAVYVPSFITPWGFTIASLDQGPWDHSPEAVDALITQRLPQGLRFYDGVTHRHMVSLPSYLRMGIAEEGRTVTDANPVFMV